MPEGKKWLRMFSLTILGAAIAAESYADYTIEEVQVTARKRAESLQEVPDSINVLSAAQIESAGIRDLKGVAALTPNLSMDDNYRPGTARISIRGMITPQVGDAPLAYVVDGVTAPSMDFINQDLHAVERIEVIKGPQGALYGKGAVGGAINIVTREPTNETEGSFVVGAGNGESVNAEGFLSGALVEDSLYYRVGAKHSDSAGFIENEVTGQMVDASKVSTVSGLLSYQLSDQGKVDLRARYSDNQAGVGYYSVVDSPDAIGDNVWSGQSSNILGGSNRELLELSGKFEWSADYGDLLFVAGYSEVDDLSFSDSDYTGMPSDFDLLFAGAQETQYGVKAYTTEVRFTAPADHAVQWQTGAYYQLREVESTLHLWDDFDGVGVRTRDSFDIPNDEFIGSNLDPDFFTEYLYSIVDSNTSDAWAIFGQAAYDLTDTLTVSAALRYDMDKRESYDWRDVEGTFAKRDFSELQPKFQLSYDLSEDVLTYVSVSRGFRSGGFNEPHPDVERVFDQEISDNFEIGFKSDFLDQKLVLNGAAFHVNTQNTQYTQFNVETFTLENLGIDRSISQGLEADFQYLVNSSLRLHGGVGMVKSEIDQYDVNPDLEGNRVPGVYRSNINLGAEYVRALQSGSELEFRVDYLRNGPIAWDLENSLEIGATNIVNVRASYIFDQSRITLFAENVTDEATISDAFVLDYGYGRQPGRPRYYGVQFGYSF
ncbi:TonB-dependent receptor [Microbulbifer salipaludis]|uniref:TonB-dependent receptor n=1 Tax=Microbulbifer salipaludis TaxID=187980 RepID=A0ABS3EAI0_9GAMM|nr:TonB-dependent receptor [Microbulbifer salipaludis]MBN8432304.1 TonB-dependent receptor [Microbulbifer salipaludis]